LCVCVCVCVCVYVCVCVCVCVVCACVLACRAYMCLFVHVFEARVHVRVQPQILTHQTEKTLPPSLPELLGSWLAGLKLARVSRKKAVVGCFW